MQNISFDINSEINKEVLLIRSYKERKERIIQDRIKDKEKEIIKLFYYKKYNIHYPLKLICEKLKLSLNDVEYVVKKHSLKRNVRRVRFVDYDELDKRIEDLRQIDLTKTGSIKILCEKWKITSTQVRRWIRKYAPEFDISSKSNYVRKKNLEN